MKIKSIDGTTDSPCSCGSWFEHWKKFSRQTITYCPAEGCLNTDLVGAHVQKADDPDNAWYIYPLCSAHYMHSGELHVSDSYVLVPASKRETCEK